MEYPRFSKVLLLGLLAMPMVSCSDDDNATSNDKLNNNSQFGKANEVFEASEWYPGGELGTDEGMSYSAETPATTNQGLSTSFNKGEDFFEHLYTFTENPRKGLGRLGFVLDVFIVIPITAMANSKSSIKATSSATVICS